MQARWVIAGLCAVSGAYWVLSGVLFRLGLDPRWSPFAVYALAALAGGALLVAHAPLRPWREPALAAVLAVALLAALTLARPDIKLNGLVARTLQPWYLGLGLAVGSGAMAAAGGLAIRRVATASPGTALILALGALVIAGSIGIAMMTTFSTPARTLGILASIVVGGFITQAVVAARRPWACGAGSALFMVLSLAYQDDATSGQIWATIVGGLLCILLGAAGAALAWRLRRRGGAPPPPDVPVARLG